MFDEKDQELLSRGLDADLDRAEMRHLYRLAVTEPQVLREMAQLLGLERGFQEALQLERKTFPARDVVGTAVAAMAIEKKHHRSLSDLMARGQAWFFSPRSVAVQPFSFVGGIAAVVLLAWLVPLVSTNNDQEPVRHNSASAVVAPPPRLAIQDVQFSQAEARVDWTNRFIVPPGAATRLSLDNNGEDPVLLQFEAVQPASLEVVHYAGGKSGETVKLFTVDGVGFATLREPRQGDVVVVKNGGKVPVLVYMRSMDGVTFSGPQEGEATRQNL